MIFPGLLFALLVLAWACTWAREVESTRTPVGLRDMELTPEAAGQLDKVLREPSKSTLTPHRIPEVGE